MDSKSDSEGQFNLTVSFEIGTDVDMAQVMTKNRVAVAEPLLPEEVMRQGVKVDKQSTAMVEVVAVELELVEAISYGEVRLILKKTNLSLT